MNNERRNAMMFITKLGFVMNIFLTIIKLLAGIFGRSSAMIADAIHSLSDILSDIIVLIFIDVASKPKDQNHKYGHGKFETFASFSVGLLLAMAGIGMLYSALG
ncbi:MAG: cation diffusion facilitator family transporter, partial [Sphingobacteriia bacterium]|nr:cation diffusion facilitator family transporter [Sphingobacteriia bacterium]